MLNIIENNSLCSRIYLSIALFFLATASNSYACTPRGHIKFHNATKMPISITAFRVEDPFSKEREKCIKREKEDRKEKRKLTPCYLRVIEDKTIVVNPGKTTSGVCWSKSKKYRGLNYNIKLLRRVELSFKHNNHVVSGPILIMNPKHGGTTLDYSNKVIKHGGNQSVITSVGCSSNAIICTVDFKMNRKTDSWL